MFMGMSRMWCVGPARHTNVCASESRPTAISMINVTRCYQLLAYDAELDHNRQELINHPRVLRVVALSGGYSRTEANGKLAQNSGMIASFSRALTEGLSAQQSDADFNHALGQSINGIYQASVAG